MMNNIKYYESKREDLIRLIPETAARILDVGCGIGNLGAAVKKDRRGVKVIGVEIDHAAAEKAKNNIDDVIVGDVEKIALPFEKESFDCIIYGDLLEHLVDPWGLLRKHAPLLKKEGCVIASIPNIAHYRVIKMLRKKEWDYQMAGILDKGHIRFFTIKSIRAMFKNLDMEIVKIERKIGASWVKKLLNKVLLNSLVDIITEQYIIIAKKM